MRTPIAGATVELRGPSERGLGAVLQSTRSRQDGTYEFPSVEPGRYDVGSFQPAPGYDGGLTPVSVAPAAALEHTVYLGRQIRTRTPSHLSSVASPVSFVWEPLEAEAAYYLLRVQRATGPSVAFEVVRGTSASLPLEPGDYMWLVEARTDLLPTTVRVGSSTVVEFTVRSQ